MQNIIIVIGAVIIVGAGYFFLTSGSATNRDAQNSDTQMTSDDVTTLDRGSESDMEMDDEVGIEVGGAMMMPSLDIVDNAANADNVTTLVAAVQAAGLVDTLKTAGPFTVFAPNNAAFAALPAGTVDTLLMPENVDQLTSILTYHVVPGAYTSADLSDGQVLTTVQGETLTVGITAAGVTINGNAMVETADVISSNGVTHVIDAVLMPGA